MIRYPITPVPCPRLNGRSRFNPAKKPIIHRYHAFRDECRLRRMVLPQRPMIRFEMPMPASWSKAKRERMRGKDHQQRPDVDNLTKAVLDAVLGEDCGVAWVLAGKIWAEEGAIVVGSINEVADVRTVLPWIERATA